MRDVRVLPEVQLDLLGHSSRYGVVGSTNRRSAERSGRDRRDDSVPLARPNAALFGGRPPLRRPFQRRRCRRPRRRPPQRATRVPPPPRSPEKALPSRYIQLSRVKFPARSYNGSGEKRSVRRRCVTFPKRPTKPAFTRRIDSRDHDDGIEATWDAVDAVDETTSSSRFRLPSPWY